MITARFVAQAWINDYAVDVEGWGPAEWDVTRFFAQAPEAYRVAIERAMVEKGEALDGDDWCKLDPEAPAWIREWQGPFSLWLRREDGAYSTTIRWGVADVSEEGYCFDTEAELEAFLTGVETAREWTEHQIVSVTRGRSTPAVGFHGAGTTIPLST